MASLGLAGLGYAATQPTKARTATVTTMTATSTTTNWTGLADQVPTPDLHVPGLSLAARLAGRPARQSAAVRER